MPTEAEWEFAAKGGHKRVLSSNQVQTFLAKDKPSAAELCKTYAGGDQLKEVGWYSLNSHSETKEVSQNRVFRGGFWFDNFNHCRVSDRFFWGQSQHLNNAGFRLVLAPVQCAHERSLRSGVDRVCVPEVTRPIK